MTWTLTSVDVDFDGNGDMDLVATFDATRARVLEAVMAMLTKML